MTLGLPRLLRLAALATTLLLILSCSQHDSVDDTPASSSVHAERVLDSALRISKRSSDLAGRLDPTEHGWHLAANGADLHNEGWTDSGRLGATLLDRADLPLHAGVGPGEAFRTTWTLEGAGTARRDFARGHGVFRDAFRQTDLVVTATADTVEHFFLLRDATAPTTFRWHVTVPRLLPKVERDSLGWVFRDGRGDARLRMVDAFAVDANGEKRAAELQYANNVMTLKLDPAGLTYPILLDPVIEVAVWEEKTGFRARNGFSVAYDEARGNTVLFGGCLNGAYGQCFGETWVWDGTQMTRKYPASSPSARRNASMAYDANRGVIVLFGGAAGFAANSLSNSNETWEWDGTNWTKKTLALSPSARNGAAMSYDSIRGQIVLFGGNDGSYKADNWTYDGVSWTNAMPVGSPPIYRSGAVMAFDSARGKAVLYGGGNGLVTLADAWEWDAPTLTWTQIATPVATQPSSSYGLVYDIGRQRTVLAFSGATYEWDGAVWTHPAVALPSSSATAGLVFDKVQSKVVALRSLDQFQGAFADVYSYDGSAWTQAASVPIDAPRRQMAIALPVTGGVSVVGGGRDDNNYISTPYRAYALPQAWLWTGSNWSPQPVPPFARIGAAATLDSTRGRGVLFGGESGYASGSFSGETWELSGATWTKVATTGPSARAQHAMAFDAARGVTVMFGGANAQVYSTQFSRYGNSGFLQDTWEWNGSVWTQKASANIPAPRSGHSMTYDPVHGVTVLFGGNNNGGTNTSTFADTWEYSAAGWTPRTPAASPPARQSHRTVWDAIRKRVVLFGGFSGADSGASLSDTWEYDGTTWAQRTGSGPPGRNVFAFAFDPARGRTVLYGGEVHNANGFTVYGGYSDTWEYHSRGGGCTTASDCDTGLSCVDGVCCEQSSCIGTCRACDTVGNPGVCDTVKSTSDPDSCTGANACNATGACLKANGQTCVAAAECALGNCVDGVCCDLPCAGACDACNGADKGWAGATNGTCKIAPQGTQGSPVCQASPTSQLYVCNGTSALCPITCATDNDCPSTLYCSPTGACLSRKVQGVTCNSAAGGDCKVANCRVCQSAFCADGYCCDRACNGTCEACSAVLRGGVNDGVCATIAAGTDPSNECSDDGVATCKRNSFCSGLASCRMYPSGTIPTAPTCAGSTLSTFSCDGSGNVVNTPSSCAPYACNTAGTACATSCVKDADCVSSAYCRPDNTCQSKTALGLPCSQGKECASGACADGVCCDSPCTGTCQACTSAAKGSGIDGACGYTTNGTDPRNECPDDGLGSCQRDGSCNGAGACRVYALGLSCSSVAVCSANSVASKVCDGISACVDKPGGTDCTPYACSNGACASPCAGDAQCVSGYFCNAGVCQSKNVLGSACFSGAQCTSGNCADGVCCDTACTSGCLACSALKKGSGTDGTCGSITAGLDPDGECADLGATSCSFDGACNGAGACRKYSKGTSCGATQCTGGTVRGLICDGFGICAYDSTGTDCAPYVCSNGACASPCTNDTHCIAGNWCDQGTCRVKESIGTTCTAGNQCASANCVDGVCCDTACAGTCQACSAAKKLDGVNGVCGMTAFGSDPDAECGADAPSSCGNDGLCDGAGACRKYAKGTVCGLTACAGNSVRGQICDGLGSCGIDATGTDCAPFACANGSCTVPCASDAHCVAGNFCYVGSCREKGAIGVACAADTHCASGHCVDSVCCDTACGGACQACSAAKKGAGVNGVCGATEAGTDPDADCADDGATSCARDGLCSGAGACALYSKGTGCGATTCTGSTVRGQVCDGLGVCGYDAVGSDCAPYACVSGGCANPCTTDGHCLSGYFCGAGTCRVKESNGAACAADTQCMSAHCIDGVCCDTACSGACQACSAAKKGTGSDGVCGTVVVGADPDGECPDDGHMGCDRNGTCNGAGACALYMKGTSCGATTCSSNTVRGQVCDGLGSCGLDSTGTDCAPYVCANGGCSNPCTTDGHCLSGYFCDAGTCRVKGTNGNVCGADAQCASGFCVDGVCCDVACNIGCHACTALKKGSGSDGACGPVAAGVDPDGECPNDGQGSCARNGTCNGAGACSLYAKGTGCGAASCTGNSITGQICDGLGACTYDGVGTDCAPYRCTGGGCANPCSFDADCTDGNFCFNGVCVPRQDIGKICSAANQCGSGFCVEGLCCDTACNGKCQACTAANKASGTDDGTCGDAKEGVDPHSDCADDGAPSCQRDGECNGSGACRFYANDTTCGLTSCSGNVKTGFLCNGTGACLPNASQSCGAFLCVSGTCTTDCTTSDQCAKEAWCNAGVCVLRADRGTGCTIDDECSTGHCVDEVCCLTTCTGQCEACDVAASEGLCVPSIGDPVNGRPACLAGTAGQPCTAARCDGIVRTACTGYVVGTVCREPVCASGVATVGGMCDGLGHCPDLLSGDTKECEPYACAADACKTECTANTHCAAGATCDKATGKCEQGAVCDGSHTVTAVDGKKTNCAPFKCDATGCRNTCSTVDDCVAPAVCDTTGKCVEAVADLSTDTGGCAVGSGSRRADGAAAVLSAIALLAAASRRRRSAKLESRSDFPCARAAIGAQPRSQQSRKENAQ